VRDLGRSVGEAKWLPNVDILLYRCIEEGSKMSNWQSSRFMAAEMVRNNRRLAIVMTGENVYV
jgi:hypothetical protein